MPTDDEPEALRLTDHHELDLEPSVRDAISLAEPIAPLDRPDCPGLCLVCGLPLDEGAHDHPDDDIDPRLEALRGFQPADSMEGSVRSIEVRVAETDDDLEAWRRVRIAVLPNERALPVDRDARDGHCPRPRTWSPSSTDELVGSGPGRPVRTSTTRACIRACCPRWRRRGVGTAILRTLEAHALALGFERGRLEPRTTSGSLAFAERFGFREVDRQVEQIRSDRT